VLTIIFSIMVFLISSVMMILPILTISAPILSAHVSFATADDDNKRSSPYTLPLPPSLQHEPSYAIRIPFGAANKQAFSPYEPGEITIPSGMTVAWFNDDLEGHTATTISNSLSSSDMLSSLTPLHRRPLLILLLFSLILVLYHQEDFLCLHLQNLEYMITTASYIHSSMEELM
jgi:hypothetical protein